MAAAAIFPFAHMTFAQPWAIAYFGIGAALIMGLLGAMAAIWSEKFDHIAAVTNFIVMPMTFLSGTFYLVSGLPEPFRTISQYNPFFYMIAGFRYGFTGHTDGLADRGPGPHRRPGRGPLDHHLADVRHGLQAEDLRRRGFAPPPGNVDNPGPSDQYPQRFPASPGIIRAGFLAFGRPPWPRELRADRSE